MAEGKTRDSSVQVPCQRISEKRFGYEAWSETWQETAYGISGVKSVANGDGRIGPLLVGFVIESRSFRCWNKR